MFCQHYETYGDPWSPYTLYRHDIYFGKLGKCKINRFIPVPQVMSWLELLMWQRKSILKLTAWKVWFIICFFLSIKLFCIRTFNLLHFLWTTAPFQTWFILSYFFVWVQGNVFSLFRLKREMDVDAGSSSIPHTIAIVCQWWRFVFVVICIISL